jgi:IclR family acetate operon transcriptional repressor
MRSAQSNEAISVIDRVMLVLECFRPDDRRLGVSELARRANLPKSTVSRLVSELVEHRYLERDGTGVRLGLRLFELGELAAQPNALRSLALEVMVDLRDATGESVHLSVLDGADVLCLGVLRARNAPKTVPRVGGRSPASASAAGRVLLAFSGPDAAAGVARTGVPEAPSSVALRDELNLVRERGVAYDVEPSVSRVTGVASAILTAESVPIAAIAACGQASTFDADSVALAVRTAARGLGRQAQKTRSV